MEKRMKAGSIYVNWILAPAGRVNDETLFGTITFSRTNQNQGRSSVNWQVMVDGHTRREMWEVSWKGWRLEHFLCWSNLCLKFLLVKSGMFSLLFAGYYFPSFWIMRSSCSIMFGDEIHVFAFFRSSIILNPQFPSIFAASVSLLGCASHLVNGLYQYTSRYDGSPTNLLYIYICRYIQ